MDNKIDKVHISYKHDNDYTNELNAITTGLNKNGISFSIDCYDILYRDNIDDYEKEIGLSDKVIMFVVPEYFKSLDCMFEMTQIFKNGNIRDRVFPVVNMGDIKRNGDGLTIIKNYWQEEKKRKCGCIKSEPGGSDCLLKEMEKINDIITTLDEFWNFICRNSTGDFYELLENDATHLIEEIKKNLPAKTASVDGKFIPSMGTEPPVYREINQNGEKSIYIENNTGSITIN